MYNTNGGPKWAEDDIECPIPFDVLADQAVREDSGEIVLLEDPAKVQARLDAQWTSVRAQQRQKLYESDWTRELQVPDWTCSVTDYEVPNKAEWVQYRQALRDVTTQADPFAIVWPQRPSP
jgi:hypothetical protein